MMLNVWGNEAKMQVISRLMCLVNPVAFERFLALVMRKPRAVLKLYDCLLQDPGSSRLVQAVRIQGESNSKGCRLIM